MRKNSALKRLSALSAALCLSLFLFGTTASAAAVTEPKSGVSFTEPSGWVKDDPATYGDSYNAIYVTDNDSGELISFSCTPAKDVFAKPDGTAYTDEEIKQDGVTIADMAKYYETTPTAISVTTYNGAQYFEAQLMKPDSSGTLGAIKFATHYDNGNLYIFSYEYATKPGVKSHTADFTAMMNTVTYPFAPTGISSEAANPNTVVITRDTKAAVSAVNGIVAVIQKGLYSMSVLGMVLCLLALLAVDTLLAFVIRVIKRRPSSPGMAALFAVIYCILISILSFWILFQIGAAILTLALLPWSIVIYKLMSMGYEPPYQPLNCR